MIPVRHFWMATAFLSMNWLTMAGQHGTVVEGLVFNSNGIGPMAYCVYLPWDYHTSQREYPVVYLLHGYSDDETGWVQFGEVNRIVDEAIHEGKISPMIIVMPDGGVGWYIDAYNGEHPWATMFAEEFVPFVEDSLRVRGTARYRAIAGLSMGGYGALIHSLKYPDMYSGCAAFSAGVWTDEEVMGFEDEGYDTYFAGLYGPRADTLHDYWYAHSVLHLAATLDVEELKQTRYYIDCGDDDFLAIGNASLHIQFSQREVPHEYRVREGAHNWTYWRTGLADGLAFLSDGFRQR